MTTTRVSALVPRHSVPRAIGPIGTLARVALGVAAVAKPVFAGWDGLQWHEPVIGLALVPAALALIQLLRTWRRSDQLNAMGPVGVAVTTFVGLTLLNIEFTSDAAFLFIGASTLVAAARGYAGCELLAMSNWLLRRNDQVGCILFTPVDAIEESVARSQSSPG